MFSYVKEVTIKDTRFLNIQITSQSHLRRSRLCDLDIRKNFHIRIYHVENILSLLFSKNTVINVEMIQPKSFVGVELFAFKSTLAKLYKSDCFYVDIHVTKMFSKILKFNNLQRLSNFITYIIDLIPSSYLFPFKTYHRYYY